VVLTRFDAAGALRILVEEEITTSQWVPTMFSRLLALPDDVRNAYCREHLARYKCPRDLRFQPELPRPEAGKILKRDLRRALQDGGP
jgi:non-ribosomal peptide synthetase component E (peptide arylation enzyme)